MSSPPRLRVGLSTCPNDTFLFHGLLTGAVDLRGLPLQLELADVQELNEALARGALEVGKASFATALRLAERFGVLRVGSALGFGVGPVLLARPGLRGPPRSVLCPGEGTTATLLLRCLHPECFAAPAAGRPVAGPPTMERPATEPAGTEPAAGDRDERSASPASRTDGCTVRQVRFDAIMPALARGEADAGVAIHEGRFTYEALGLSLLEDLGASWERLTGGPVPLGGLLARRDLTDEFGADVHARLCAVLRDSLALARARPADALATMRRHAQELDDAVLWQHVELYVNARTEDLGDAGARALAELARRAARADGAASTDGLVMLG